MLGARKSNPRMCEADITVATVNEIETLLYFTVKRGAI